MAGDEEKKKIKKKKKVAAPVEEAPAAAAEPEPAPEPVKEPEPAPEGDPEGPAWKDEPQPTTTPSYQEPEEAPAEAPAEEVAVSAVAGEEGELPPQPKKKPRFFVHWDRRKPKFYDYNFDYGTNYYRSMVGYVDQKNTGTGASKPPAFCSQSQTDVPRRMAFAERGMYSSLERSRNPDVVTQNLLSNVRSSIRNFEHSQKNYAYGKRV